MSRPWHQKIESWVNLSYKQVLADSMTKIVQPFSIPSVDELAELMTSIWTERDIIFQEVKSDLSKTRLAKEKAEDQSRRDAEALRAAQDPTKTKAHLIKTQEQSKVDQDQCRWASNSFICFIFMQHTV